MMVSLLTHIWVTRPQRFKPTPLCITTITLCRQYFLNVLAMNENVNSVWVDRRCGSNFRHITFKMSFRWHVNCHDKKFHMWLRWSFEIETPVNGNRTTSRHNNIMWRQLQIVWLIYLFVLYHCRIICNYDTHRQIWEQQYDFHLVRQFRVYFNWNRDDIRTWYSVTILLICYPFHLRLEGIIIKQFLLKNWNFQHPATFSCRDIGLQIWLLPRTSRWGQWSQAFVSAAWVSMDIKLLQCQ